MPLTLAPLGTPLKITKRNLDSKEIRRHFDNLGLIEGEKITTVSTNKGDIIIKVKDGRLAINKALAMKILVELQ